MLVAGSVIIGRREEGKETGDAGTAGAEPTVLAADSSDTTPFADEPEDASHQNEAFKDAPSTHELESTDKVWSS